MTQQQTLGHIDVPASGPAFWRAAWSRRHTVTFAVAVVAMFLMLTSARPATSFLDGALLGLAAAVGALTLATYVPPAGVRLREHLVGGSCGAVPAIVTLGAPVLLSQSALTIPPLLLLLTCYAFAAAKRITDHASC
jgi:hypothetical protein